MTTATGFSSASRVLFVLAAFIIVVAGMRAAESLMVTFLLSGFFAIICTPPFIFMQRKGVPAWLSLIFVVIAVCLLQLLLMTIVTTSVSDFSNDLPGYQERINALTDSTFALLASWGLEIPQDTLKANFDPSAIFKLAVSALGNLGAVLSNSFLIILTVIFMLFEGTSLPAKLHRAFGEDSRHMEHIERFLNTVKQYMTIKALISLATGLMIYLWLLILGVDYPLLWALLAFLFNFVPKHWLDHRRRTYRTASAHSAWSTIGITCRCRLHGCQYGDGEYHRAPIYGERLRAINPCCISVIGILGMGLWPRWNATIGTTYHAIEDFLRK